MKRTTLSALLLTAVCSLCLTGTSNAQFYEEINWSSSRNSSTSQTWSTGPAGTVFHSEDKFSGHDAVSGTRVTPGRVQGTEMRRDFGGFNEVGRMSRPVPGGVEHTGFNNSGAWRTMNGVEYNVGQGGNFARGINSFDGFNSNSGFRQFDGFGGSHGQQFNNSNSFGGGNAWHRSW